MKIGNKEIGPGLPPFIVAEIGANHGGSLDRALRTMEAAKAAGADAVKFQAYTASTITLDCDRPEFTIKEGPWAGRNLHELYKVGETPFEWFPKLAAHAEALGIPWFASVFDKTSVDLVVKLGAPAIKIASFELVDLPLIRYAASKGLPMILSTGMASDEEVWRALDCVTRSEVVVLHCVSEYPAAPSDYRLEGMSGWSRLYGVSDHTMTNEVVIAATALAACMVEKHFCLNRRVETEDSAFSLDPVEFSKMVLAVRNTWAAMQGGSRKDTHRDYRRSLYAVADIRKGELFTEENVRSIRPGGGLPPDAISEIIGRRATGEIQRGEPLCWEMVRGK